MTSGTHTSVSIFLSFISFMTSGTRPLSLHSFLPPLSCVPARSSPTMASLGGGRPARAAQRTASSGGGRPVCRSRDAAAGLCGGADERGTASSGGARGRRRGGLAGRRAGRCGKLARRRRCGSAKAVAVPCQRAGTWGTGEWQVGGGVLELELELCERGKKIGTSQKIRGRRGWMENLDVSLLQGLK